MIGIQIHDLGSDAVKSLVELFQACQETAIEHRDQAKEFSPSWNYYDGVSDGYLLAIGAIKRQIDRI